LPGLDGLRALAVGAVLLFHADLGWMSGGFLGVDVFFVISGFLITALLLKERAESGTISFKRFWQRRARRLLPALYGMLIITTLVASLFYRSTLADLRSQLFAASTYWTNWYLIGAHHSYFAAVGRPPMLQHLWSLAVEEQFYLIWPLVLVGLLRAFHGRLKRVTIAIGVGALASALWMATLHQPLADPSRVYYGTDTRLSGLLLGAVLALFWQYGGLPGAYQARHSRGHAPLLDRLSLLALAGILACFFFMNQWQSGLYPGGLLVVSLLTLVVIAAVIHPRTQVLKRRLAHRNLVWMGKRSYGLYLWHWPIFVVTRPGIDVPFGTYPTLILRLALTFMAASLSYRYIEQPIRKGALGDWLAGLRQRQLVVGRRRVKVTRVAVFATVVIVAFVGYSLMAAKRPVSAAERSIRFAEKTEKAAASTSPSGSLASFSRTPAPDAPPTTLGPPPASTMDPKTMTVITDSVLLGARQTFIGDISAAGWQVDYRGHIAMTIPQEVQALRKPGPPLGSVVVVGLGYNTSWQRNRANFKAWSDQFDREAEDLLATLKQQGAKSILWVTLREPSASVIPRPAKAEFNSTAWYFPYVNERLHALQQRHPDLLLADWAAISNRPGITYDSIHLNPDGARLMTNLVRTTLGI
jgi:peptidoglycan/LPS O-acetylase OafA/YrhL